MSIFVSIEDLEGDALVEVFEIEHIYKRFPKDSGLFLRFIGDTADASFNALQSPGLLAELEAMAPATLDPMEAKELDRVTKVCARYAGKKNVYVKFYAESKSEE